jgi:catechol 2,3-dioxygenase-like lactoylglutathione lyase family enzyme
MTTAQTDSEQGRREPGERTLDMHLEVVVIPVSNVDRAKDFYASLGWRLDVDRKWDGLRLVQFTPPGSGCSIQFGENVSSVPPGGGDDLYLSVVDAAVAHDDLVQRGIAVEDTYHCDSGTSCRFDSAASGRVSGVSPDRASYGSFCRFQDPDGNRWLLQEVTARAPGRMTADQTSFGSVRSLADAMRRASKAHGEHEARIGAADENWPDWYAQYMVSEQAGTELPL